MKKLTFLLVAMLALAGCPGKKSPTRYNGDGGVVAPCMNCGAPSAAFSQAVTSELPQASLTLIIQGDLGQMNMLSQHGQNPLFSYQGPITVSGTLNVVSPLLFTMCQLPVGQYSVRTIQAGVYNIGEFLVPAVELVGPTRMVVSLNQGVILTNGNGAITSFGALIAGLQGPVINLWGQQQNMAMGNCGDHIGVRF